MFSPQCHPENQEGGKKKIIIAYQLVVTFGHITFGWAAWVLSILTRPLHSQRAIATEGVDEAG